MNTENKEIAMWPRWRLPKTVRELIAREAIENPEEPAIDLAAGLSGLIAQMGEPVPSQATIIRYISKARRQISGPQDITSWDDHYDPLDEPFDHRTRYIIENWGQHWRIR